MVALVILIVLIVLGILCLVLCFYNDILELHERIHHPQSVYKTLSNFANENDFLLLNNVRLYLGTDPDEKISVFNHILFGDKYVYLVQSFYAKGGIYGNIQDEKLFLRDFKNNYDKTPNPVLANETMLRKLENTIGVSHADRMFVSVVVYNNSLLVPKGIAKKEQGSWFLPLKDLEKTVLQAEKDDVTAIKHDSTELLAKQIRQQSERTKAQEEQIRQRELKAKKDAKKKK